MSSIHAVLTGGEVYENDVVELTDGTMGRVKDFWQKDGECDLYVRIAKFATKVGDPFRWLTESPEIAIINTQDVIEPLPWYCPRQGEMCVVMALI